MIFEELNVLHKMADGNFSYSLHYHEISDTWSIDLSYMDKKISTGNMQFLACIDSAAQLAEEQVKPAALRIAQKLESSYKITKNHLLQEAYESIITLTEQVDALEYEIHNLKQTQTN